MPTGTFSRRAGFGWHPLTHYGHGLMAKTVALHGYARGSTAEQTLGSQLREHRAAGCVTVAEERASGGDPSRPVLADLLDRLGRYLLHLATSHDLYAGFP
ncbi:MAG: hypothetical protein F4103_18575 [Boseongicola sp. SB0673_bin_14]|nr:hypothetical protein [Boseongicola sp. SB0673_bin_14]